MLSTFPNYIPDRLPKKFLPLNKNRSVTECAIPDCNQEIRRIRKSLRRTNSLPSNHTVESVVDALSSAVYALVNESSENFYQPSSVNKMLCSSKLDIAAQSNNLKQHI